MRQDEFKTKLRIYSFVIIGLLTVLLIKLAIVQLFYNDVYQVKARENRIRLVSVKAPRGEIYDRNGEPLATNELVYTVSLNYLGVSNQDKVIDNLTAIINPSYPEITADSIREKIDLQKNRLFEPVIIVRDIPWELVVKIEENRHSLPGVDIGIEPLRVYPNGALAGHVLGYIHSISPEELAGTSEKYNINSLIGKTGIEKKYERELRGKDGARRVEVNAQGRPVGELVTLDPQPGNNLTLTLDKKLQTVMEKSMDENLARLQKTYPKAKVGSAVLLDVKTGEVLAMCSRPALNPDDFKGNLASSLAPYYFPSGSYNPLNPGAATNRAITATYPPGSTFKPITGMAALSVGAIDPLEDYVNCPGQYWIAPYISCTGVHGNVNYYSGMAHSCNTYFQEIARRAGKEAIIDVARKFGLGEKTGIDLPEEISGTVPTPEWKKKINSILIDRQYDALRQQLEDRYSRLIADAKSESDRQALEKEKNNERKKLESQYQNKYNWDTVWQAYDTFNMSIGQGGNQYTVIQLANYVAAVANGGDLMKPHLLKSISSADKRVLQQTKPEIIRNTGMSTDIIAETKAAMLAVTQPGGTASFVFAGFPANVQVAAKTGTAETGRVGDIASKEFHGVFVAFAPVDNPQVAFAGVIEYGQHGSESAGYVAKAVFEQYFGLKDHYAAIQAQAEQNNKTAPTQAPVNTNQVTE